MCTQLRPTINPVTTLPARAASDVHFGCSGTDTVHIQGFHVTVADILQDPLLILRNCMHLIITIVLHRIDDVKSIGL